MSTIESNQFVIVATNLVSPRLQGYPVLAHDQSEHDERYELRRVGLGGGHSDLRPGVDVDSAVALATDGRADGVGDADYESSALLAVSQCHQRVRCLS